MTNTTKKLGQCLCGAVKFTANESSNEIGACHCAMCRSWGGGPFMGVDCGADVTFDGDDNISVFNSSEWAERGFCKQCGSHLFYRIKQTGQMIVPIGVLQDDEDLVFDHQVFVDEKPHYYSFSNDTEDMTGAEVFAKFLTPS